MGITPAALRLLAREVGRHRLEGAVLTLGNQDVWGSADDVLRVLEAERLEVGRYELRPTTSALFAELAAGDERFRRYIHATTLFEMLGFSRYADLDKYAQDGTMMRVDLNEPLPGELRGGFDLLLDLGTTEHVFSVPAVLSSILAALKVGGRVIHALPLPSLYWAQHGYYCFSPDLFLDFYEANGFDEIECTILYYAKPLFRPLDHSMYFRPAHAFPYRRGVNLNYVVPADSVPTFWLTARKDRELGRVNAPNQEENHLAAAASARRRMPAAARAAFFALQPLLGGLARRLYLSSMGLVPSRV